MLFGIHVSIYNCTIILGTKVFVLPWSQKQQNHVIKQLVLTERELNFLRRRFPYSSSPRVGVYQRDDLAMHVASMLKVYIYIYIYIYREREREREREGERERGSFSS